jgi:hypothetical protein
MSDLKEKKSVNQWQKKAAEFIQQPILKWIKD